MSNLDDPDWLLVRRTNPSLTTWRPAHAQLAKRERAWRTVIGLRLVGIDSGSWPDVSYGRHRYDFRGVVASQEKR